MIKLGVNIDHIATLREVRKAKFPDLLEALSICKKAGADQITVHLREDRRHIQDRDVIELLKKNELPVNLEMAFVAEMISNAVKWKPYSATLVPERRAEMTTESGLDLHGVEKGISDLKKLQSKTKVYGFIDPDEGQVQLAKKLGLSGVEFHTGPFAHAFEVSSDVNENGELKRQLKRLERAAKLGAELGLEIKAGHGLTLENVKLLLHLPSLTEFNIGHSIICRAVMIGLEAAVREMKRAISE